MNVVICSFGVVLCLIVFYISFVLFFMSILSLSNSRANASCLFLSLSGCLFIFLSVCPYVCLSSLSLSPSLLFVSYSLPYSIFLNPPFSSSFSPLLPSSLPYSLFLNPPLSSSFSPLLPSSLPLFLAFGALPNRLCVTACYFCGS